MTKAKQPTPTYKGSPAQVLIKDLIRDIKKIQKEHPLPKKNAHPKHKLTIEVTELWLSVIERLDAIIPDYLDKQRVPVIGDVKYLVLNPYNVKLALKLYNSNKKQGENVDLGNNPDEFSPMLRALMTLMEEFPKKLPGTFKELAPFVNLLAFEVIPNIRDSIMDYLENKSAEDNASQAEDNASQSKAKKPEKKEVKQENNPPIDLVKLEAEAEKSYAGFPQKIQSLFATVVFGNENPDPTLEMEDPYVGADREIKNPSPKALRTLGTSAELPSSPRAPVPTVVWQEEKGAAPLVEEEAPQVLADKIAEAEGAQAMLQDLIAKQQAAANDLEDRRVAEEKELSTLTGEMYDRSGVVITEIVKVASEQKHLGIEPDDLGSLQAAPIYNWAKHPVARAVLEKSAEIVARVEGWELTLGRLQALSSQIQACKDGDERQLFTWISNQYDSAAFGRLLKGIGAPEEEQERYLKVYSSFTSVLSVFSSPDAKQLYPIKKLLQEKVPAKIQNLSAAVEAGKALQPFDEALKKNLEQFEIDVGNMERLETNLELYSREIEASKNLIESARVQVQVREQNYSLLSRIRDIKGELEAFRGGENSADPMATIVALRLKQLALMQELATQGQASPDLAYMTRTCANLMAQMDDAYISTLMGEMQGFIQSMSACAKPKTKDARTLNAAKIERMEKLLSERPSNLAYPEEFQPLLQQVEQMLPSLKSANGLKAGHKTKVVAPSPVAPSSEAARPEAPRSCCYNFLLKAMASNTARNIALVVLIAGVVGVVIAGLALGGVPGVAAFLAMSVMTAKITAGAGAGCVLLGSAGFFGNRKAAKAVDAMEQVHQHQP